MRRHRPPSLVSMWMLDVFCCALGCVTILWLLKTREASDIADEASQASSLLVETRGKLDESEQRSALRLANAERLAAELDETKKQLSLVEQKSDENARILALMMQERDKLAKNLALVEKDLARAKEALALVEREIDKTKKDLIASRTRADDLTKTLAGTDAKLTASDAELIKKRGELENLTQSLELSKKQQRDLEMLVRVKEKARLEAEIKLTETDKKLDDVTRTIGEQSKMQARITQLEKDLKSERTRLDEANTTIIDLQGTKAKLADKIDKLMIDSENRFAGIAMTGKNVVFLVDMSGSMDMVDENTQAPNKWPTVCETVCKVMRTLPDLQNFQVILFSGKVRYLLDAGDWMKYEKEKSIDRVRRALSAIKPVDDTNLYAAFEESFKYRAKGLDTIYLFSDGLPTSGPGLTPAQDRALTNENDRGAILSRYLRRTLTSSWNKSDDSRNRVRINSIGFFYESPDVGAFLWALSRENDGSFVGMSKP
jgi:chromosome segregation ATPase